MKMAITRSGATVLALVLAGCTTFPASRGLDETRKLVADRGGPVPPAQGPVDCADPNANAAALTAEPMTADTAVQVTLLCNAGLAAEYARLGISRADAFQAARVANPVLSAAALDSSEHGAPPQIELGLVQSFTSLLLRGPRKRLAEGEFLRAQQQLAGLILQLSAQTKADYFVLVGAQQVAAVRHAIADAMQTSAELARCFRDAGNLTPRAFAEYQAAASQAVVDARAADNEVASARVALLLQLGLPEQIAWSVPDRLSLPLAEEDALDAMRSRADQSRLDLAAAHALVKLLADSEAVTRKFRWLGDFSAGVSYERDPDRSRLLGPSLSIQLPIFDQGQGPVARATALRTWGEAEQRRLTLTVDGEVQLAHQRVANARGRVEDFREHLIPQRRAVVARTQEEQNYMLVGVFELFAVKRQEFDTYQGYLEALRDYWVARSELERAVGACLPSAANQTAHDVSTQELLKPESAVGGMQHMHHGGSMPGMDMQHMPGMDMQDMSQTKHGEQPVDASSPAKPAAPEPSKAESKPRPDPHAGMDVREPEPTKDQQGNHEHHGETP